MSSHPEPQSEHQPTPAYVRVFRSYLRNVSSPAVWAPLAIIALLLALSADYWNSLRVLDETDPSLISDNTSQLAESVSEASSINASEIDSSDVLSDLLSKAELPVMADDNSVEAAEKQAKKLNLEEVDLLGLPDLSQGKNSDKTGNKATGSADGEASTTTPSRRLSLLEALSGSYRTGAASTNSAENSATNATTLLDGQLGDQNSSVGMTGRAEDAEGREAVNTNAAVNGFNRSSQTSTLVDRDTEPAAALAQFNSSSPSFTGYPYGSATVPNATGVTSAPIFTGYPASSVISAPAATPYTSGYTGYATSPYVAPAPSTGTSAPNSYGSPSTSYGSVQYGSQPTTLNTPTGMNTTPIGGSPQTGYPIGTPSSTTVQPPAATYSVPRSAPGRYIGNGEINTFANP